MMGAVNLKRYYVAKIVSIFFYKLVYCNYLIVVNIWNLNPSYLYTLNSFTQLALALKSNNIVFDQLQFFSYHCTWILSLICSSSS